MLVTIHQPNTFPWLGYFAKMHHSDVHIFLDDVQFERRGYSQRVRMNGKQSTWWLTVPVMVKGLRHQKILEAEIAEEHWRARIRKRIYHEYSRARQFQSWWPQFSASLGYTTRSLRDYNLQSIEALSAALGLSARTVLSSQLGVRGAGTRRIVDLVESVGGSAYLSGSGARRYQEERMFSDRGIALLYMVSSSERYDQIHGVFRSGLSAWDAILNVGSRGAITHLNSNFVVSELKPSP